jgi:hypothetical protein
MLKERTYLRGALIGALLINGSHNFHYSAWGEGGLTEFGLTTDSPAAVEAYQDLFEHQWERSLSSNTDWSNSSK